MIKKSVLVTVCFLVVFQPILISASTYDISENTQHHNWQLEDTAFVFNQHVEGVSQELLSDTEMKETEGKFFLLMPILMSTAFYSVPALYNRRFSWYGLGWAVGSGVIGGGMYGRVATMMGRSSRFGYYWMRGNGIGITQGLNFSNPWRR